MAGGNLTTVNALLKEVYEGRLTEQYSNEVTGLKRIERSSAGVVETVGGKYVTFPIRVGRNTGISYRAEEGQIADPGNQSYAAVQVKLKYGYGRFKITGQAIELAETNYQSFASALTQEMDGLKDDLVKDSARIFYGNTSNGVVAKITDTTTSASHTVDTVQYLSVGELVDVLDTVTGAQVGTSAGLTITAINETTKTITLSGSVGATTATSAVYRAGNRLQEPTGLDQICSATVPVYGLDPATQPIWAGNTLTSVGALLESWMIAQADRARQKGAKITAIFTSLGVRRAYFSLLTQQRRIVDTKSFTGGFQALAFNYGTEIPVVEDVDAKPGTMYFIDETKIKEYKKRGWYFEDRAGSVLQWVRNFDIFEGMAKQYWELGTSQRNAHTMASGITEG